MNRFDFYFLFHNLVSHPLAGLIWFFGGDRLGDLIHGSLPEEDLFGGRTLSTEADRDLMQDLECGAPWLPIFYEPSEEGMKQEKSFSSVTCQVVQGIVRGYEYVYWNHEGIHLHLSGGEEVLSSNIKISSLEELRPIVETAIANKRIVHPGLLEIFRRR